jgi:hypothetical protein
MGREVRNPALRNLYPMLRKWKYTRRIPILEEKVCVPTRLGAIESQGGPEDSQIGEAMRNHRLDHRYDPRDLIAMVNC